MARIDPQSADDGPPGGGGPAWMGDATRPAGPSPDDDQEIWLLSYSDLVTLLFSLFVMLTAITAVKDQLPAAPPPEPPVAVVEASEQPSLPPPPAPTAAKAPPIDAGPRLRADEIAVEAPEPLSERWLRRLATLGAPAGVTVQVRDDRIGIDIGAAILFPTGQAELSDDGRRLLAKLIPALAAAPGDIMVEGHADPAPLTGGGRYPSNWELSAARAAAVVRALIVLGLPPERLAAVGYADTKPLTMKTDPESLARNRRVTLSLRPGALGPDDGP